MNFVIIRVICSLLFGVALTAPAFAQIHPKQIELAATAALRHTSGVTDVQLNLLAGWHWHAPHSAEIRFGFQRQRQANLFDYSLHYLWQWKPQQHNVPFVQIGIGGESAIVGSFGEGKFVIGGGGGIRNFLAPRIALRSEYVFRRVLSESFDYSEHGLLVGIAVFLK
jgi:hypothetical protein